MTRCESYPLCSGTIYFPTAPSFYILYNASADLNKIPVFPFSVPEAFRTMLPIPAETEFRSLPET